MREKTADVTSRADILFSALSAAFDTLTAAGFSGIAINTRHPAAAQMTVFQHAAGRYCCKNSLMHMSVCLAPAAGGPRYPNSA